MRHVALALCLGSSLLGGCDELFPELAGSPVDMANFEGGDDLTGALLSGHVCVLGELTQPFTCAGLGAGLRVTIEESRVEADVAADGTFAISLAGVNGVATLAVSDGTNSTSITPTVVQLSTTQLAAATADGVSLPCVPAQTMTALASQAGASADPSRGAILAWLFSSAGAPVAGASVAPMQGTGPLYDSGSGLSPVAATGPDGTLAYLALPAGDATLMVTTSPMLAVAGGTFTAPIRGGAVTAMSFSLPSR